MHEVIQLGHEDGSSPSLILGSFVAWGVTDNSERGEMQGILL